MRIHVRFTRFATSSFKYRRARLGPIDNPKCAQMRSHLMSFSAENSNFGRLALCVTIHDCLKSSGFGTRYPSKRLVGHQRFVARERREGLQSAARVRAFAPVKRSRRKTTRFRLLLELLLLRSNFCVCSHVPSRGLTSVPRSQ